MGYRTYNATSAISASAGVTSAAAIAAVAMTAITLAFAVFLPARTDSNHASDHGVRSSNIAVRAADTPSSLAVVREHIEVVGARSSDFAIAAGGDKAVQCARATC